MDFFDKLGKKASEAYKVTADKTGKLAKETKLKFKMGELKSKIEDIYEEIGKKVYEKHVKKEEISTNDLLEECKQIDEISNEIEKIRQECLELKDKKQCQKCFKKTKSSIVQIHIVHNLAVTEDPFKVVLLLRLHNVRQGKIPSHSSSSPLLLILRHNGLATRYPTCQPLHTFT